MVRYSFCKFHSNLVELVVDWVNNRIICLPRFTIHDGIAPSGLLGESIFQLEYPAGYVDLYMFTYFLLIMC